MLSGIRIRHPEGAARRICQIEPVDFDTNRLSPQQTGFSYVLGDDMNELKIMNYK